MLTKFCEHFLFPYFYELNYKNKLMKKITLLIFMLMSVFGFAQFPAPYCGPITFTDNVEPITLVNFAGINNSTDATAGTTNPEHEDFTAIVGNVVAGSSYSITLKGNTDGSWTTK
jgi:hypothetical protein